MRGLGGAALIMLGLWVSATAPAADANAELPVVSGDTTAATDIVVLDDVGGGASISAVSNGDQ